MDSFLAKVEALFKPNESKSPPPIVNPTPKKTASSSNVSGGNPKTPQSSSLKNVHIQKIGLTKDRSQEFLSKRNEKKQEADRNTRKRLDQLARVLYTAPKTSSPLAPIIRTFSFSKNQGNQHCLSCGVEFGILTKKVQCVLCEKNFCVKCIKKLSNKDITAVVTEGEEINVCARCFIVVTRDEESRRFAIKYEQGLKKFEQFTKLYNILKVHREEIVKLVAQYEYLTSSLNNGESPQPEKKKDGNFGAVYESAASLEKSIVDHFKDFQIQLKNFVTLKVSPGREAKMKTNIQTEMMNFLQDHLPQFRRLRKDLVEVEMKTLNNLYIVTCRLAYEDTKHSPFWKKFGDSFTELLKIIEKDLVDAVIATGQKWDKHKQFLDQFIYSWNTHSQPLISDNADTEPEPSLIRKNVNLLQDLNKKFEGKVGEVDLLCRQALIAMIQRLEDAYYEGAYGQKKKEVTPSNNPYYPLPHPFHSLSNAAEDGEDEDDDWHFL